MPKQIHLSYLFHCKPEDLFFHLHNPKAMQNWLAEKVTFDTQTKVYTFFWKDYQDSARLAEINEKKWTMRWEWLGEDHEAGEEVIFSLEEFEESIELSITDCCNPEDEENYRKGWDKMMKRLARII